MVKKTKRPRQLRKKRLPPSVPPRVPPTAPHSKVKRLFFPFPFDFLEYRILKKGKRLEFLCWLHRKASIYPRVQIVDDRPVFLLRGQGVFRSSEMATIVKVSKNTAKKYMRDMKKKEFVDTKRYPTFTVYTLLKSIGYDQADKNLTSNDTPLSTPTGTPPSTPVGTPSESSKSEDNNERIPYACANFKIDLPEDFKIHLLLSYVKAIRCEQNCQKLSGDCKENLMLMTKRIKRKLVGIKNYRGYADIVVKNFLKHK